MQTCVSLAVRPFSSQGVGGWQRPLAETSPLQSDQEWPVANLGLPQATIQCYRSFSPARTLGRVYNLCVLRPTFSMAGFLRSLPQFAQGNSMKELSFSLGTAYNCALSNPGYILAIFSNSLVFLELPHLISRSNCVGLPLSAEL